MIVLGIECTAHTLSIGIVKNAKIMSNIIDGYRPPKNEGLIPRKLADHHARCFSSVLREALKKSKINLDDVDRIAFSQGPGIGSALAVGCGAAKYLAAKYNKRLIGVNHCYAHVKIGELLTGLRDPLILYLSGGNSQIILQKDGRYHVLGETLDIGIGNLFDCFARTIGLKEAHGGALEKMARNGRYLPLPYSVKGMNLVFSGLLTQAEKLASKERKEDVAFSLMETAFSMTCEATERALFLTKKRSLLLCGGVAQNKRLQEMLREMCKENGVRLGVAPDEFNRDNGAMIAYAGEVMHKRKKPNIKIEEWIPLPNQRIDRI